MCPGAPSSGAKSAGYEVKSLTNRSCISRFLCHDLLTKFPHDFTDQNQCFPKYLKIQNYEDNMTTKGIIIRVAKNKPLHIFLGLMTVYAGFSEIWETISDDFLSANIRAAHGVIFVGVIHILNSFSEFVESADYLKEGVE